MNDRKERINNRNDDRNDRKKKLDKNKPKREQRSRIAPGLDEIRRRDGVEVKKVMRDLSKGHTITEQSEEDNKREYLFKFSILKKSYPSAEIPVFTIHSDYSQMKKVYNDTVMRLSLDSSVDSYKKYLIALFVLVEYIMGSWFSFDMKGYTQQQVVNLTTYQRLLIELGEKSYVPGGSKWPVELRLLGLVVINTALFILAKIILAKTGSNVLGMFSSQPTGGITGDGNNGPKAKKRKMRGPGIDIDDIPDVETL
jgi:hypothetical protein